MPADLPQHADYVGQSREEALEGRSQGSQPCDESATERPTPPAISRNEECPNLKSGECRDPCPSEYCQEQAYNADLGRDIRWRLDLTRDDLQWLEFAIADYIAKWGEHWTGKPYMGEFGPSLAGLPTAMANMAMTVIRKRLVDAPSHNGSSGTP